MMLDEKFLKFIFVGIINTLVGTAIMFGLYNLAGCSYWLSSAANYFFTSILSYALNRRFTFQYRGKLLQSGARFAGNIAACYLIAYGVAKPLVCWLLENDRMSLQENVAMLAGMCIFTGLNYIGQRFFVFGEEIMEYQKIYREWMESPYVSDEDKQQMKEMSDKDIYEAFYQYVAFGTAGMRGVMGLGTNRINKYTIRMAAKGLAQLLGKGSKVAIAYDTRNNSADFAEETARVLAAAGIKALVFDRYSPVPLLSFAIRELKCDGGVVITASHNTKEYNGFKVYDNTGCQMNTDLAGQIAGHIAKLADGLAAEVSAREHENIEYIGEEVIEKFLDAVQKCSMGIGQETAANLNIIYTPLHGSGKDFVMETLRRAGFENVTLVQEQAGYDGDFPTVKKPNPEDRNAFHIAEEIAVQKKADILLGTDPDCDRIGAGVRADGQIVYLTGNQMGTLLIDFLARMRPSGGKQLITTIVTSDMGKAVAKSYGVDVMETLTGFKYIGDRMNRMEEAQYFMGYEESYGYLPGTHARDKDGVSAALLICQMAAYWKAQGKTLADVLQELYEKHGYWIDAQESFTFEGSEGSRKIAAIMETFRQNASIFSEIGEMKAVFDYNKEIDGLPPSNVLKFVLEGGSWIAIRPSGTEPKIKFYYCITGRDEQKTCEIYDMAKAIVRNAIAG